MGKKVPRPAGSPNLATLQGDQLSVYSMHVLSLLKKHLSTFAVATGTNVGLASLDGVALFPQRTHFPRFCQLMASEPAGAHACRQTAIEAAKYALEYGAPYISMCHAGLIEWCVPVVVDGICLGMVMGGQVVMWDMDDLAVQEVRKKTQRLGIDASDLDEMIREVPAVQPFRVQAVASTLTYAINHLVSAVHWREILAGVHPPGATAAEVVAHIKRNYWKPLTVEQLAAAFYVSPSHLARLFRQETGYSIVNYLTRVRLEKARELLAESELPAGLIGRRVGFDDGSYFGRVFKKHEGVSPAQYRRRQQNSGKLSERRAQPPAPSP